MVYLPVKKKKGKHWKYYIETKGKIPSKSELLQRALRKAIKDTEHEKFIDFVPARFVTQLHGWASQDKDSIKNLKKFKKIILTAYNRGINPIKYAEKLTKGKFHIDLRIFKLTAPSWFGLTLFSNPATATAEKKSMGTVKGYSAMLPLGRKLQRWLTMRLKLRKADLPPERPDRLYWMKYEGYDPPGSGPNPTRHEHSYMIILDSGPAVLHRRSVDFIDVTLLGKKLFGRYYYRLVERKLKPEELPKTYKKKYSYSLYFYWWKAKKQFNPKLMKKVAAKTIRINPVPAPPAKKK